MRLTEMIENRIKADEEHECWFRDVLDQLKAVLKEEGIPYENTLRNELTIAYQTKGPIFEVKVASKPEEDVCIRLYYPFTISESVLPFIAMYVLKTNFNSFLPTIKYEDFNNQLYIDYLISRESIDSSGDPGDELYRCMEILADSAIEHYEVIDRYTRADFNKEEKESFKNVLNLSMDFINKDRQAFLPEKRDEWLNDAIKRNHHLAAKLEKEPTIIIPHFLQEDEKKGGGYDDVS